MPNIFFHDDSCTCRSCVAWENGEESKAPKTLLMPKERPVLRLVGVELEISGIDSWDATKACELSDRGWKYCDDASIPFDGKEIVSPPFKSEAGFDKAVEILTYCIEEREGKAFYDGECCITCDYCNNDCQCSYCRGYCGCDYCEAECHCPYCKGECDCEGCLESPNTECEGECTGECMGECTGECECEQASGSTGFHVHVDARDLTKAQREAVALIYQANWQTICSWHHFSRKNNEYCRINKITERLGENPIKQRYQAVNLTSFRRHGTIEFRQAFLPADRPEFVKEWALWCRGLVDLVAGFGCPEGLLPGNFLCVLEEWNFSLGKPGENLPSMEEVDQSYLQQRFAPTKDCDSVESLLSPSALFHLRARQRLSLRRINWGEDREVLLGLV